MDARAALRTALFLAVALLLWTSVAIPATYVVRPDGTGDFPTIQAAIDACVDGDVVELTDGTFTGDGNRDMDYLGKAIAIQSQSGNPGLCVIHCEGTEAEPHRGFSFLSGEQAGSMLTGITIKGGWAAYPEYGAAVQCEDSSSPSISSCIFSGNMGSAVSCRDDCSLSLTNCRFTQNQGSVGGGIHCRHSLLTIGQSDFIENAAESDGGAIYGYYAHAEITDCTFTQNTSHNAGAILFDEFSEVDLRDCLFEDNSADQSGGAIDLWLSTTSTIERCAFVCNSSGADGGALRSEKICNTYVKDCTFWGNASPGGVILAGNYQFVIENTVIAFSTEGPGVVSHYDYAELTCCDIFGNADGDWVGTIANQYGIRGNISEDPLFCDAANGDFTLAENSPCAPFSPPNPECDLIGASPIGCGATAIEPTTWGSIKAAFQR